MTLEELDRRLKGAGLDSTKILKVCEDFLNDPDTLPEHVEMLRNTMLKAKMVASKRN